MYHQMECVIYSPFCLIETTSKSAPSSVSLPCYRNSPSLDFLIILVSPQSLSPQTCPFDILLLNPISPCHGQEKIQHLQFCHFHLCLLCLGNFPVHRNISVTNHSYHSFPPTLSCLSCFLYS